VSDLFQSVDATSTEFAPPFDIIVSNPPYVSETEYAALAPSVREFEPRVALVGGSTGAELAFDLVDQAAERLKPGGKLFETCAAGNLLMLAPCNFAARGEAQNHSREKAMTRHEAQVLNRIAQLIADDGAVEIDYKGAVLSGIDEAVAQAVSEGSVTNEKR